MFGFKHVGPSPNRSVSTSFTSTAWPSTQGPGLPREPQHLTRSRPAPGSGPAPATPLYGGGRAATWAAVKRRAPPRPWHRRCEPETTPGAGLPGDPTMAGLAPRVEYLAGFCCPLGGLAAGKPRVLCHGPEVFLSTGSELVYVYDREGRLLIVSTPCRGGARDRGRGRGGVERGS